MIAKQNVDARQALVNQVNEIWAVKNDPSWHAQDKSEFELILTILFKFDDKWRSKKSQWLKALENFLRFHEDKTESAFVAWVERKKGIIKAGKATPPGIRARPPPCIRRLPLELGS